VDRKLVRRSVYWLLGVVVLDLGFLFVPGSI